MPVPWLCSAGCKDDLWDVWLQWRQHHGHQRVWDHHQQPAAAGQKRRCHQNRLQGATWVSMLPACLSQCIFVYSVLIVTYILYMAYPNGCWHAFTFLPRLRPYPLSEHATCLHVCISMRISMLAEHKHHEALQLTVALHVWCSVLFMSVFMWLPFHLDTWQCFIETYVKGQLEQAYWLFEHQQHESAPSDHGPASGLAIVCLLSRSVGLLIEPYVKTQTNMQYAYVCE